MSYNFSGKSRENRMQVARDHTTGRSENLANLRKAREQREADQRKVRAATQIQRVYRGYRSRLQTESQLISSLTTEPVSRTVQVMLRVRNSQRPPLAKKALMAFIPTPVNTTDFANNPNAYGHFLKLGCDAMCASASMVKGKPFELYVAKVTQLQEGLPVTPMVQRTTARFVRSSLGFPMTDDMKKALLRMLHSAFIGSEKGADAQKKVAAELDNAALRLLMRGRPVLNVVYPTATPRSLAHAVFGLTEDCITADDVERVETALLGIALELGEQARSEGAGDEALQQLEVLLAGSSASFELVGQAGVVAQGEKRLRGINALVSRAAGSDALVERLLAALREEEDPAPSSPTQARALGGLYDKNLLGVLGTLEAALLGGVDDADTLLSLMDAWAGLYVLPWLSFGSTPERRRKALSLISRIAHSDGTLATLWRIVKDYTDSWARKDGRGCLVVKHANIPVLFCHALVNYIDSGDFVASVRSSAVFDENDIRGVIRLLRDLVYRAHMSGCAVDAGTRRFARASHQALARLHAVDERGNFIPTMEWLAPSGTYSQVISVEEWQAGLLSEDGAVSSSDDDYGEDEEDSSNSERSQRRIERSRAREMQEFDPSGTLATRTVQLLQHAPFLLPFTSRIGIFGTLLIDNTTRGWGYINDADIVIPRDDAFNTAFEKLRDLSPQQLMGKTRVRFRGESGLEEGFGDGVFRDFIMTVCEQGFAPSTGLFVQTQHQLLHPRPFTELTVGSDHLARFHFLGRMLGKALRQGILLDLPFAPFVRNSLLGRTNGINDLPSLDPELHKNLMSLREMPADHLPHLELAFTVTQDCLGAIKEIPLVPNGDQISVHARNLLPYIHLMADFKLNRETRPQMDAFRRGLDEMIEPKWLRFFDSNELQVLFQGQEDAVGLDVADWRSHTTYGGRADVDHPAIRFFWQVVEEMTPAQQRKLLKFATSVSRAPLLGFRHMTPNFNITVYEGDTMRLPSAATCMCMLKLPAYPSYEVMKEKLLLAIETNTFEMS